MKISIVTPSFNQGRFLEETMCSVIDQGYPELEYMVVDGGSTDDSVEVIRAHQERLSWWTSQKDEGQYDAINKGFQRSSGEVMAWLNADDKYLPWTLSTVADVMKSLPEVEWLTTRFHFFWDETGRPARCEEHPGFSGAQVLQGGALPGCGWPAWAFIQQEATFWRRSLWNQCGAQLNGRDYSLAADFDLWMRFAARAELYFVDLPLAGFRQHAQQKTGRQMNEYLRQAKAAFSNNGGRPPGALKGFWLKNTGKLIRHFQRRHAAACGQRGRKNHAVFDLDSRKWELRKC